MAKKPYIFVIFQGGGGPDPLFPRLDLTMAVEDLYFLPTAKSGLKYSMCAAEFAQLTIYSSAVLCITCRRQKSPLAREEL